MSLLSNDDDPLTVSAIVNLTSVQIELHIRSSYGGVRCSLVRVNKESV